MPNRIVRESILTSDPVDSLSAAGEVFYRRLLNVIDDFGRFDGRLSLLIASCFPLRLEGKRRVREADLKAWLQECVKAGLVATYAVDGKAYIVVHKFGQQIRAQSSRYPEPPPNCFADSGCVADAKQTRAEAKPPRGSAHLDEDVVVVGDVSVVVDENAREAATAEAPPGVSPDNWLAWRRHRGKKLTAEAERLQRKHLAEWRAEGHDPNRIVENALAGGWQGLHPPDKPKAVNGHHRPATRSEQRAQNIAELTGRTTRERTIEGTADRVGGAPLPALPGDLRKPGRDDVG